MEWVRENFQIILAVAGAIAYWLNQRAREKAGQEADYDDDGKPEVRELTPTSRDGSSPEEDERVRRIQEEIRRKIAERRGQAAPPPVPASVPTFDPFRPVFQEDDAPSPMRREEAPPPMPSPVREVVVAYADEATLERQRKLAAQLAELEERRREARRAAQAAAQSGGQAAANVAYHADAPDVPGLSARRLHDELRSPAALRRAMVLREVLGAPVALR
jgi:hypothetical protein